MSTETEALERFFAAVNRNDMQAITRDFDPQNGQMRSTGPELTIVRRHEAAAVILSAGSAEHAPPL